MTYRAILTEPFHQVAYDLLGEDWEIVKCKPGAEGIETACRIGAIAAIIGGWKFGPDVMDQMPGLMVVARPGKLLDHVPVGVEGGNAAERCHQVALGTLDRLRLSGNEKKQAKDNQQTKKNCNRPTNEGQKDQ